MPQGSPVWQGVILCVALVILLWETWRGWRAGVIRSGLRLAAMTLSVIVGFAAGQVAAAAAGGTHSFGGVMSGLITGTGVALIIFFALWLMGALLFKRTAQQSSGIVRFFWGLGGAFFGFVFGLLILWGALSLIRATGTIAEARMVSQVEGEPLAVVQPSVVSGSVQNTRPAPASAPSELTRSMVTLKQSLEMGQTGKILDAVDLMPPDYYGLLFNLSRVTTDKKALLRFMEYPGIKKVLDHPRVVELLGNPDLIKAAEANNFPAVLTNKALISAAQDPTLAKELEGIDIRAALKFALEKPTPSPSPSPISNP